ncbi:4,5-DOPA dioxygenase extradiol [Clostridium minihomine]|uniref:4,5-DOPA-extradiol-dioxygenase n=1 Tax=Clostridium minihomine TaxID=2045012 RepID=UPI000C776624|nr:4,5-DOPA dioxygenase extradiol [Clostridium minihomine]
MSERMPALFVGHGSPMNAVESNSYTKKWEEIGQQLPRPKAILMVSAHWYTHGTRITNEKTPRMVYDMYGFPEELYRVKYPCPGSPELALNTAKLLSVPVQVDNSWGLDHGAWSVLSRMFPEADIPVVQLSVDGTAPAHMHFQIGRELSSLRDEGIMIMGSGNVVHNLARISWQQESGFSWAEEFDSYIRMKIEQQKYQDVVDYEKAGASAKLAFPTPDHFYPLLYVLGAAQEADQLTVFNSECLMGSMSMTGYLLQ